MRVIFTDNRSHQETLTSAATAAVEQPLTAAIHMAPESHDGQNAFTFRLHFSEHFTLSYKTLRDHAFTVTGGEVRNVRRVEPGKNVRWEITVQPSGNADVTVSLPVTTDCASQGAICTGDSRMLSTGVELVTPGPSNSAATGTPTITGTAQVSETLTAATTDIADADGLTNATFSYQWVAGESDISEATGSSYTLVSWRGVADRSILGRKRPQVSMIVTPLSSPKSPYSWSDPRVRMCKVGPGSTSILVQRRGEWNQAKFTSVWMCQALSL